MNKNANIIMCSHKDDSLQFFTTSDEEFSASSKRVVYNPFLLYIIMFRGSYNTNCAPNSE